MSCRGSRLREARARLVILAIDLDQGRDNVQEHILPGNGNFQEGKMLRRILMSAMLSLAALQGPGNAQDLKDLRSSLQGCLDAAMAAANFDKARMGERGTLVLHCSDQEAQKLYASLGTRVPERNHTFPNRDRGAERRFGLSTCYAVKEKASGASAEEFSCRIAISVGASLLESF